MGIGGSAVYSDELSWCNGETIDAPLAEESGRITASWNSVSLSPEQREAIDEFDNVVDNPYPWAYVG